MVSGSNCEGDVGAVLLPEYGMWPPLGRQVSHSEEPTAPSFREFRRAPLGPCDGFSTVTFLFAKRDYHNLATQALTAFPLCF